MVSNIWKTRSVIVKNKITLQQKVRGWGKSNHKLLPKFPQTLSITLYFYCKLDPNATDGNLQKINNFYLHFLEKCLLAALKISHRNNLVSVNFKTLLSENNLTMLLQTKNLHDHINTDLYFFEACEILSYFQTRNISPHMYSLMNVCTSVTWLWCQCMHDTVMQSARHQARNKTIFKNKPLLHLLTIHFCFTLYKSFTHSLR